MMRTALASGLAAVALSLAACGAEESSNEAANGSQPAVAGEAAGNQTIAAGLDQNSRFSQAAKAAGLDATLAGPGPYTVLVPADQAFNQLPQGQMDSMMQTENRAQLTETLTYHILPGTVLVEDIQRAIANSNGRAILATMGGQTLTATRDGDRLVLADSAGNQASIVEGDQRRSNGVVHMIDNVLIPSQGAAGQEQGTTQQGGTGQPAAQ